MTLYLDTSLLVAGLTAETETQRVQVWLQRQISEDLLVSDWVIAEFSAALSIKLRTGQVEEAYRATALGAFSQFCAETATVLPVSRDQFHTAARFADQYALGLRGGDALHLAICAHYSATLCTLDHRLSDAGPELGIATLMV